VGYDRFCDEFGNRFPAERQNIERYISRIRETGDSIERLSRSGLKDAANDYVEYYGSCFSNFLDKTFQDTVLRNVIAGMNMLYAGVKDCTPLYIPMMIHSSFLNGAYRFTDGGSQLSDLLCREIKACGGTIVCI
jgi:all-trans-retinol 13,14-reductase